MSLGVGAWTVQIGPCIETVTAGQTDWSVSLDGGTGYCDWTLAGTSEAQLTIDLNRTNLDELNPVTWRDELRFARDGVPMWRGHLTGWSYDGRDTVVFRAKDWTARADATIIESDVAAPTVLPAPGGVIQTPSWDIARFLDRALHAANIHPGHWDLEPLNIAVQAAIEGSQRSDLGTVLTGVADIAPWWVLDGVLMFADRSDTSRAVLTQQHLNGPVPVDTNDDTYATRVRATGNGARTLLPGQPSSRNYADAINTEAERELGFKLERRTTSPWQDTVTIQEAATRTLTSLSGIVSIGSTQLRSTAPVTTEDLWPGTLIDLATTPVTQQPTLFAQRNAFNGPAAVTAVRWNFTNGYEREDSGATVGPQVTFGPPDTGRRSRTTDPVVRLSGVLNDLERRLRAIEALSNDPRQVAENTATLSAIVSRLNDFGLI